MLDIYRLHQFVDIQVVYLYSAGVYIVLDIYIVEYLGMHLRKTVWHPHNTNNK